MYKFISKCEQDTINFAENFAKELNKKDIIAQSQTGTGKTYVYLRSIFELNKRYYCFVR